ncbi:MAG: relaxase/mobilization nuclease domain-containing protein [Firmicutes bacterium]|nr:relaxase/mobilization nuclease domain-containing protein [Bacillota bacterium]
MATTRIIPIHAGGRNIAKALRGVVNYIWNPLKTNGGELVSTYNCAPETIEAEFVLAKRQYCSLTGRSQGRKDIIAYHARQSFKPGEITPQEANRIGYELAIRFTKGRHAFAVYTHTDRRHIHNHILWNSTTLDCRKKFRDFFRSGRALRRCSDVLCAENGLSVIENPKPGRGKSYGEWLGADKPLSFQEKLRRAIDAALGQGPSTFEEFLSLMREAGYQINDHRKHITFLAPGQKQPTRLDTLRGDYTEEAVRARIAGRRIVSAPAGKGFKPSAPDRPTLLIDIEAKMREGKGPGFERWAKVQNLKQMARTLIYLQENGLNDYSVLKNKAAAASARFNALSSRIKALDEKMAANAALQKYIINYSKTRQVYIEYRKAGYSKKFRELHMADILLHQAAKEAFDELGLKKLPTIASLRAEYAPLLEEKKRAYAEYRAAREEMRTLLTAKSNVDRLLGVADGGRGRESRREEI